MSSDTNISFNVNKFNQGVHLIKEHYLDKIDTATEAIKILNPNIPQGKVIKALQQAHLKVTGRPISAQAIYLHFPIKETK